MKKIIVAAVLCLILVCPDIAVADTGSWVRVVKDDVHLYATADGSKITFTLQKTYYAHIISQTEDMYCVTVMPNSADFPQITGYVRKSQVDLCEIAPLEPHYPTVKVTVNGDSAAIKLSPVPSSDTVITATNTQQLSYYGSTVYYGQTWYYVYYAGKFGYVDAQSVTAPIIAPHPTPLPEEDLPTVNPVTPPSDGTTEEKPKQSPASEILLIVFVAVFAVGITLALFLPGNSAKKDGVFDKDI